MNSIPSQEYPGFFEIPGFNTYVISKDGIVINQHTGKQSKQYVGCRGYCYYRLKNNDGIYKTIPVHRTLMLVFCPPHEDPSSLTIDHINANRSDNRLENLEWVSIQENIRRASEKGLYAGDRKIPVETLNPFTGEITFYSSRQECATANNLSLGAIRSRLACSPQRVFPEGLQYRFAQPGITWEKNPNAIFEMQQYGNEKSGTLKNTITGEYLHFNKLSDMAAHIGKSPAYISEQLTINSQPILEGGWLLKLDTDPSPWRNCDYWAEFIALNPHYKVVEIIDSWGFLYRFETINKAARYFGINTTCANYRVTTSGETVFSDGSRWGYYPVLSDNYSSYV